MNRCTLLVALLAVGVSACRPDDQRTDSLDAVGGMLAREEVPAAAIAQLDSGSAAIRATDLEAALRHYGRVTEIAPDFGAGWFGVYMAASGLGDEERARVALEEARRVAPGASLLREDEEPR